MKSFVILFIFLLQFICNESFKLPRREKETKKTVLLWTYYSGGSQDQFFEVISQHVDSISAVSVIAYELNTQGQLACMNPDNSSSLICPYWDKNDVRVEVIHSSQL